MLEKKHSPINSVVFISGKLDKASPEIKGFGVFANSECIACTCYPEIDGPTKFLLGNLAEFSDKGIPDFDGVLDTPTGQILITTVNKKVILQTQTGSEKIGVQVWRSHPKWPETVTIGWYLPSAEIMDFAPVRRA